MLDSVKPNNSSKHGSVMYGGGTQLGTGTTATITVSSNTDITMDNLFAGGVLTGTVKNADLSPAQNVTVQVRSGGTTATEKFITIRTRGDGSYAISLPSKTYERVSFNGGGFNADSISVTTGNVTTQNATLP